MAKDQVIGRDAATPKTTPPLGTGTVLLPSSSTTVPPALQGNIATAAGNVNVVLPKIDAQKKIIDSTNFIAALTKAQMKQLFPYLKKLGAAKNDLATYANAKDFLLIKHKVLVDNSGNSLPKLINIIKDELTGLGGSSDGAASGTKSNGVTQYVTKQDKALVAKDVDKFLLSTIGSKNINQASRDKIMAEINKMIEAGTTTTSKMDKKTGKTTVVQTPGYSEERLGEVVSRVARQGEPEKYEQQRQLNFFDFMQQAEQMRGGR
jgi:hypothetical protein